MSFDLAFDRLMGHEGGYSNDPNDPGGETNWGISKRSYPDVDIKNLSREEAKAIYRRDFWNPIHGDNLPFGVAFQAFDFAVNSSVQTAIRHLQRALDVADDGFWGPTSQGASERADEASLLMRYLAERLKFMTKLNNWPHAGKGWARRIANNLRFASQDS